MSKLAALAAKRRQKEAEQPSESSDEAKSNQDYLPSLKRLQITPSPQAKSSQATQRDAQAAEPALSKADQESGGSVEKEAQKSTSRHPDDSSLGVNQNLRANPSAFASIMTNHDTGNSLPASVALFPGISVAKSFNFAEPSPDDIVTKAQSAKGRMEKYIMSNTS